MDYGFIVVINNPNKDLQYKDSHLIKIIRGLSLVEALTVFMNRFKEYYLKDNIVSVVKYSTGFSICDKKGLTYDILVIRLIGNDVCWIANYEFLDLSQYVNQIQQLIMESHTYTCMMFEVDGDGKNTVAPVYKSHRKMELEELVAKTYNVNVGDVTVLGTNRDEYGTIAFTSSIKMPNEHSKHVCGMYRETIKDVILKNTIQE